MCLQLLLTEIVLLNSDMFSGEANSSAVVTCQLIVLFLRNKRNFSFSLHCSHLNQEYLFLLQTEAMTPRLTQIYEEFAFYYFSTF